MPPYRNQVTTTRIWWDSAIGAYRLQSPYNPGFVEFIKAGIASPQRSFDEQTKIWTFTEPYLDAVVKTSEKIFGVKPQVITRQQVEAAQAPPVTQSMSPSNLLDEFFGLVPYDAMRRAYLVAANTLHPDHGGDMEKMTKLNATWQRLEREFYKKES